MKEKKYIEVLWCGRGGQGAITASKLVASAAFDEGFKGITTAPSFGAERRGAPVSAFLRLAYEPIRIFSQITDPDIIVILDPTLLPVLNLAEKFEKNKKIIINSTKEPSDLGLEKFDLVGIADVAKASFDNDLTFAGVAILNTPILGALVKTTELILFSSIEKAIRDTFSLENAELNLKAANTIYNSTKLYKNGVIKK